MFLFWLFFLFSKLIWPFFSRENQTTPPFFHFTPYLCPLSLSSSYPHPCPLSPFHPSLIHMTLIFRFVLLPSIWSLFSVSSFPHPYYPYSPFHSTLIHDPYSPFHPSPIHSLSYFLSSPFPGPLPLFPSTPHPSWPHPLPAPPHLPNIFPL